MGCQGTLAYALIPFFIVGLVVWACMECFIFYPYMHQEWDEADRCKIASVDRYALITNITEDDEVLYAFYSLFKVNLEIDGVWRKGYACGSELASDSATIQYNGTYPYEYGPCMSESSCGTQLLMPLWYCSNCKVCDQLFQEERTCWWFIKHSEHDHIEHVEDFPPNYDIEYPTEYSTFIQVRFREEEYFDYPTYEAFYALTVGVLMGIPLLIWGILGVKRLINKYC
jgi:hypothetical protein